MMELRLARVRQGQHLHQVAREVRITASRLLLYEGGHRQIPQGLTCKPREVLTVPPCKRKDDAKACD